MRKTTRRHFTSAVVAIALLVAATPGRTHAGSPARQFFAPAKEAGKPARVRTPRSGVLRKVGSAPVLRHVLHPVRTFRRAGASAKEGVLRAIDHVQIAHVERQIRKRGSAEVPSRHQIKRAHLQQRRWKRTGAANDRRFEPSDEILVASDHLIETPLAPDELVRSAAQLRASVSEDHALLPVDTTARHVTSLVDAALDAVGDRAIYGAPNGVRDVLENHTVAFDVVERTFEAARAGDHRGTAWLTDNQRAVLEDVMAEGDDGAAW